MAKMRLRSRAGAWLASAQASRKAVGGEAVGRQPTANGLSDVRRRRLVGQCRALA